MPTAENFPSELRVLLNHIYEYQKGVRNLILYTMPVKYKDYALNRLSNQKIDYAVQNVDESKFNLYFGRKECIEAIKFMTVKPMNLLSPEEDFMLGTMLGYNICMQCERFCDRKRKAS